MVHVDYAAGKGLLLAAILLVCTEVCLTYCPRNSGEVCGLDCQVAVCTKLVRLAEISNASADPTIYWDVDFGWREGRDQGCAPYITANPHGYCRWYGIRCCVRDDNQTEADSACPYPNAIIGVDMTVNNVNVSLDNASFLSVLTELHQCGLVSLNLEGNKLSGTIPPEFGAFVNLELLNLANNWIEGTLPAELSALVKLRVLDVSLNLLHGLIPLWLGSMTELRSIKLGANIGTVPGTTLNGFYGAIPDVVWGLPQLEELSVEENSLNGSLPSGICGPLSPLRVLVLRGNKLTGDATPVTFCRRLELLDLQNNRLEGSLPASRSWSSLQTLQVNNNRFKGTIPNELYDVPYLHTLDLANNQLSGPLSRNVTKLTYLTFLRASQNQLNGSLPRDIFYIAQLSTLDLSMNTQLNGEIYPSSIEFGFGLTKLVLSNTSITGVLPEQLGTLPNLAYVDVSMTPKLRSGGVGPNACKAPALPCFLQFSEGRAPPTGPAYKNMLCKTVVRRSQSELASAPCLGNSSYYPVLGAEAFVYPQVWILDPAYYCYQHCTCVQGYKSRYDQTTNTFTCLRDPGKPLPLWIVGVIVPVVLGLGLGGGFLVGFLRTRRQYQPRQLRRKLMERKWKRGLPRDGDITVVVTDIEAYSELTKAAPLMAAHVLDLHNKVIRGCARDNCGHVIEQEGDSFRLAFREALDAVTFCLQAQQALLKVDWPQGLTPLEGTASGHLSLAPSGQLSIAAPSHGPDGLAQYFSVQDFWSSSLPGTLRRSSSFHRPPKRNGSAPSGLNMQGHQHPKNRFFQKFFRQGPSMDVRLFDGPRVRMGVVTSRLGLGQELTRSRVFELAKVVSDAAQGGQVLLCRRTFLLIKDRLQELGAVESGGINYKSLRQIDKYKRQMRISCYGRPAREVPIREAVLLDMGEYALDGPPVQSHLEGSALKRTMSQQSIRSLSGEEDGCVRTWQILPPSLAGRSLVWCNDLRWKEGVVCTDLPYFAAPGTAYLLGTARLPVDTAEPLPPITTVFCIADGAKEMSRRLKREVHALVLQCLRRALKVVYGGYLCQQQPGELKYMLTFYSPEAALEWCLTVQEALMYLKWPESILSGALSDNFGKQTDGKGGYLFCGPRLRMGLCEGPPSSILPDHTGRADYYGTAVNQAARYADIAAVGGQVVCEQQLANKVFSVWKGLQEGVKVVEAQPPYQHQSFSGSHASGKTGQARPILETPGSQTQDPESTCAWHTASFTEGMGKSDPSFGSTSSAASLRAGMTRFLADIRLELVPRDKGKRARKHLGPEDAPDNRIPPAPLTLDFNEGPQAQTPPSDHTCITMPDEGPSTSPSTGKDTLGPTVKQPGWAVNGGVSRDNSSGSIDSGHGFRMYKSMFEIEQIPREEVEVVARHIGSYRFKGMLVPVTMVNVLSAPLLGRVFTDTVVAGKGMRVSFKSGVANRSKASLPHLAEVIRVEVQEQMIGAQHMEEVQDQMVGTHYLGRSCQCSEADPPSTTDRNAPSPRGDPPGSEEAGEKLQEVCPGDENAEGPPGPVMCKVLGTWKRAPVKQEGSDVLRGCDHQVQDSSYENYVR